MSEVFRKPSFAFISLVFVLASGVVWISNPKLGIWFTLLALLPWTLRWLVGKVSFHRTPFDWLLAIFLITAWVGYWAAYDKTTAWIKVWLIVTAVLLYYSLSAQPKENFNTLSLLSFCIGLGVASYFFLTQDFTSILGSIAHEWMNHRPHFGWHAIHHGYISGLLVVTNIFAAHWLWQTIKKPLNRSTIVLKLLILPALGIVFLTFILTMSRGIWAAVAGALGIGILWKFVSSSYATKTKVRSLFPAFVLIYLAAIILFVYIGPARSNEDSGQNDYGRNSRAEVFERGTYFLQDYPFTGAGLNSFPGLYSEYVLSIPYFYFINSYNMFLDVAIEQGLVGGVALILIYIGSVWLVSSTILKAQTKEARWISWSSLFALILIIIHGLFYDYLYFGNITMLLFLPVGISIIGLEELNEPEDESNLLVKIFPSYNKKNTRLMFVIAASVFVIILVLNSNKIISFWYANLGAVQMSKVELQNFPAESWGSTQIVPQLGNAEALFHSALRYNPHNRTANYRLGLISMLRQDFASASINLTMAYGDMPGDRGIIKNLGYCYAWLGEVSKAKVLLAQIPEAQTELSVYVWWWKVQGRQDLAENALELTSTLQSQSYQP